MIYYLKQNPIFFDCNKYRNKRIIFEHLNLLKQTQNLVIEH